MAEETKKKKRKIRSASESVRERAVAKSNTPEKKRRVQKTAKTISKPFKAVRRVGGKTYFLPLPDNRLGRFMNKRRYFIPRYFKESWQELKQVTWPDRKETTKLTLAVFTFALIFGILVAVTDYGLDQLFKRTVLK
jgi:preprotein translocase SecE subunit